MSGFVVDAENVRRSVWPNVTREELVALCGRLARLEERDVVVVFDGPAPELEVPARVRLHGEAGRSADDLIVELVPELGPGASTVATSDRGLRARLVESGVSVVGGGAFVRHLLQHRSAT
jgi:hypothetical protein